MPGIWGLCFRFIPGALPSKREMFIRGAHTHARRECCDRSLKTEQQLNYCHYSEYKDPLLIATVHP